MDDVEILDKNLLKKILKPRARYWHKGLSGSVCVIGGNIGMSGAAVLAGIAALRVGAGLVRIATRPQHAAMLNLLQPELMCHAVEDAATLTAILEKSDVIVIGPGLGRDDWARELWKIVSNSQLPTIVDADALHLLAENPLQKNNMILTPHPGEAAVLLQTDVKTIQADRVQSAISIAKKYQCINTLKGAGTLIANDNGLVQQCNYGNPGMATAGMGDVLSGVIAGLIAQGIELNNAAAVGVLLHALAGDAAAAVNGERGILASDLFSYLCKLGNP